MSALLSVLSVILVMSAVSDRSSSETLTDGMTLRGEAFISLEDAPNAAGSPINNVTFFFDDPQMVGPPVQFEQRVPWDFKGGSVTHANPFDTTRVSDGVHVVTALISYQDGTSQLNHVQVQVNNSDDATGHESLLVSTEPDRSSAGELTDAEVSGDVYVFVWPDEDVGSVLFFLNDPGMTREPVTVERIAPYDFNGTAPGLFAFPFDTTGLANGSHTVTAVIDRSDGTSIRTDAAFTVNNGLRGPGDSGNQEPDPSDGSNGAFDIRVSKERDSRNSVPMDGATVSGQIYGFVAHEPGMAGVQFYVDDPDMTGRPYQVESNVPWDLAGGSSDLANALDTRRMADGSHSVTALVAFSDGSTAWDRATFNVSNDSPPEPTATPESEPTPSPTPTPRMEPPEGGELSYFAGDSVADTSVSISGEKFFINGRATHRGVSWNGHSIEGLLLNSRMVNGVYDATDGVVPRGMEPWDPRKNTEDFIASMRSWREKGLDAIAINMQGGSNRCHGFFGDDQPIENNLFGKSGTQAFDDHQNGIDSPFSQYLVRMGSVIREADDLGMVVILGLFYFGQDQRIDDGDGVVAAVDATVDWVLENGWTNVIIEVSNESMGSRYQHRELWPTRIPDLIARIQERSSGAAGTHLPEGRLLVSSSMTSSDFPPDSWISASDYVLLHGNNRSPGEIRGMVERVRERSAWRSERKPILFNEDSTSLSSFEAALEAGAGWGYYDNDGYQCVYSSDERDRWTLEKATEPEWWDMLAEVTR
ncbi:MAG: hypothetical protein WD848_06170 [Dehalococcoidia bacterium]